MSTTTLLGTRATPSAPTPAGERQPVWTPGVAAAAGASVAATALAAPASVAGVSFADRTGAKIPLVSFAQLTLVFSLIGVGVAAVIARKARRPRATFVRTAVALTGLSFVPDLTFGFDVGSAATLITLHTVAAEIRRTDPGCAAVPAVTSASADDRTVITAATAAAARRSAGVASTYCLIPTFI